MKIYLPRLLQADPVNAVPAGNSHGEEPPIPRAEASETILLVEDNEGVRVYAKGVLEEFGYHVLEAADAKQALGIVAGRPRIDVLFTDVVLPGLTGRELAEKTKEIYPNLPVLFTTGYTRNAIVHQGRLDRRASPEQALHAAGARQKAAGAARRSQARRCGGSLSRHSRAPARYAGPRRRGLRRDLPSMRPVLRRSKNRGRS